MSDHKLSDHKGVVDWELAQRVADKLCGTSELSKSYLYHSLETDFQAASVQADEIVAAFTGLRSASGPPVAKVVTRSEWVAMNMASFERLLGPVFERLDSEVGSSFRPASRAIAGAEMGAMLGWMSQKVLGQYDPRLSRDLSNNAAMKSADNSKASAPGDVVYFVGPNILEMEKRFGFPPSEFRLWIAIHEFTHRAQFTGVPWMRDYYLSLLDGTIGGLEADPAAVIQGLKRAVKAVRESRNPLTEAGIVGLLAGDKQKVAIDKIAALMSLLEGHGDVVMNSAAPAVVPSAARFASVLSTRRGTATGLQKAVRTVIGLEAKMRQYAEGERFLEAVEAEAGPRFVDHAWTGPQMLPTLAEIAEPHLWINRVRSEILSNASAKQAAQRRSVNLGRWFGGRKALG